MSKKKMLLLPPHFQLGFGIILLPARVDFEIITTVVYICTIIGEIMELMFLVVLEKQNKIDSKLLSYEPYTFWGPTSIFVRWN